MLLSKLDQRCEAAFVHIKIESGGMWRDGVRDRKELFVDWYLKKQRPLSPCMPLILILFVSVRQYFDASFVSALVSHRFAVCVEYITHQCLFHIRPGLIYQ